MSDRGDILSLASAGTAGCCWYARFYAWRFS